MVSVTIGGEKLICSSYKDVYESIVEDLAFYQYKKQFNLESAEHLEKLYNKKYKYAIYYYSLAEKENVKNNVKSDYDLVLDHDDGAIFDLLDSYLQSSLKEIRDAFASVIGKRIIRNYEINVGKKIDVDVQSKIIDYYESGMFFKDRQGDDRHD